MGHCREFRKFCRRIADIPWEILGTTAHFNRANICAEEWGEDPFVEVRNEFLEMRIDRDAPLCFEVIRAALPYLELEYIASVVAPDALWEFEGDVATVQGSMTCFYDDELYSGMWVLRTYNPVCVEMHAETPKKLVEKYRRRVKAAAAQ